MGVTVKKCHMMMSGNDCWNKVCFSCRWKADNELADVTLSGSLFQNRAAATGNARLPTAICHLKHYSTVKLLQRIDLAL